MQEVKTKKIAVGDIVCVRAEEDFPCDLVLLTSSDREGQCHIQTANLDGETNLKVSKLTEKPRLKVPTTEANIGRKNLDVSLLTMGHTCFFHCTAE